MTAGSNMREQMPESARWVDARRAEWGAAHVNTCLRKAIAGEPGWFYAMERGHVLGTPFPATSDVYLDQQLGLMLGAAFAAFMARPGSKHGQD